MNSRNAIKQNYSLLTVYCLVIMSLLFQGCGKRNPLFYHLSQDYSPVGNPGTKWTYQIKVGSQVLGNLNITLDTTTVIGQRKATQVTSGNKIIYWSKTQTEFAEYIEDPIFIYNTEIIVERRWRTRLFSPPLTGQNWNADYSNTEFYLGKSIKRDVHEETGVLSEETVSVPKGSFDNCFKLKFIRKVLTTSEFPVSPRADTTETTEWFAPRVGMVKRAKADTLWELLDYEIK